MVLAIINLRFLSPGHFNQFPKPVACPVPIRFKGSLVDGWWRTADDLDLITKVARSELGDSWGDTRWTLVFGLEHSQIDVVS